MEVKRRINQFFGSILRKDKVHLDETYESEEIASCSQTKHKKGKNNQSYSQWDLIEHIAGDAIVDEPIQARHALKDNVIYSDGLAYSAEQTLLDLNNDTAFGFPLEESKKQKSFLKRSGTLLRKSFRRSKKKAKKDENASEEKYQEVDPESLSNVVQEINTTLLAVATFGVDGTDYKANEESSNSSASAEHNVANNTSCENRKVFDEVHEIITENRLSIEHQIENEWEQQYNEKSGFKTGLRRQASRLVSKFQRNSGSMRLKTTVSVESFPCSKNRRKSESKSKPDLKESDIHRRTGSFRRTLSFKRAKKVMSKGASSFGKSMMHASAVMPISYESPPVTFYPDYENEEYPAHLVHCYYRTVSYQPKDSNHRSDKGLHQHGHCARPTSFYQHGYCYNG